MAVMKYDQLVEAATAARRSAYAPYSQFSVGAALITKAGKIYTGCNIENVSLGLTICASIIQAHGGRLTVVNQESGGVVAGFSLPAEVVS